MSVTIAFLHAKPSLIGKLIKWWTRADGQEKEEVPYHVEIAMTKNSWYSASTRSGVWRNKKFWLSMGSWRVYTFNVSEDDNGKMLVKAINFLGSKYDWLNILGSDIMGLGLQKDGRLTCDEGVALVLRECELFSDLDEIALLNPNRLEQYIKRKYNDIHNIHTVT